MLKKFAVFLAAVLMIYTLAAGLLVARSNTRRVLNDETETSFNYDGLKSFLSKK